MVTIRLTFNVPYHQLCRFLKKLISTYVVHRKALVFLHVKIVQTIVSFRCKCYIRIRISKKGFIFDSICGSQLANAL